MATITTKPPEAIGMKDMKEFTCNCLRQPQMHVAFNASSQGWERLLKRPIQLSVLCLSTWTCSSLVQRHQANTHTHTHTRIRHTEMCSDGKICVHKKRRNCVSSLTLTADCRWNGIINLKKRYGFKACEQERNPFSSSIFGSWKFAYTSKLVIRQTERERECERVRERDKRG